MCASPRPAVGSSDWLGLWRLFTLGLLSENVHKTLLVFPRASNLLPGFPTQRSKISHERVWAKLMVAGNGLNVLKQTKADNLFLLRASAAKKFFGEVENGRQTRSVATSISVHDKVGQLGDVVVVSGGFAAPVCDVLIPARLKGWTRFKEARDDRGNVE